MRRFLPFVTLAFVLATAAQAQTIQTKPSDPNLPGATPAPAEKLATPPAGAKPSRMQHAQRSVVDPAPGKALPNPEDKRKIEHDLHICIGC
jgi:hypothetical protein